MLTIVLSVLLAQVPAAPQQPRDSRAPRAGTGVIRGRVIAGDSGLPLRRAVVTLNSSVALVQDPTPGSSPMMRTTATDAEGRFAFRALPAATYHVRVAPGHYRAQYLMIAYGSRRPMEAPRPIELKDGQRFDAGDILLPRGGAITGRVIDDDGEAVARVDVSASMRMPNGVFVHRSSGSNQTDDQGRFRLYGLEPGDYVVSAAGRGVTSYGGPPIEGASEGFMMTYAPAALVPEQAQRIRVEAGADAGEVQLQLVRTRTFKISGTVVDSQGQPSRSAPMLSRRTDAHSITSSSMAVDPAGAFSMRDVLPGDYTIVVRPERRGVAGAQIGDGAPQSRAAAEFAEMPITITSDLENIVVVTRPGVSIAGQVVLEDGSSPRATAMRVSAQPSPRAMYFGHTASATIAADLRFTLDDLFGPVQVRLAGPPAGYAVKNVMLGGTDITDTYTEFKPGDSGRLQIVLTSRIGSLEGTATGDGGDAEGFVLLLPQDRAAWTLRSARTRTVPLRSGRFSIDGLLAGTYYAVALSRPAVTLPPDAGPEALEPLVKLATMVVVAEGEKRTVDLRMAEMPEVR
jgi:hypothetical protein